MVFKLSNGETFTNENNRHAKNLNPKHHGPYLRVMIKKEYDDGTVKEATIQPGELTSDKRVTVPHRVINRKTSKVQHIQATYLLAENEDYRDYPSVNEYLDGGYASNADYTHTIELVFKNERYTQRLFKTWRGNVGFYSMLSSLEDDIREDIENGDFVDQGFTYDNESNLYFVMMYNDTGDLIEIEIEDDELFDYLMSARVIQFESKINT